MKSFSAKVGSLYHRGIGKIITSLPQSFQDDLYRIYSPQRLDYSLRMLKKRGFAPKKIVDCGAFTGEWSKTVKKIFPEATVLMIEPQADKEAPLKEVVQHHQGSVQYVRCLMGPAEKAEVTFFEVEGGGSGVLEELTGLPKKAVTLPMKTMDGLLREKNFEGASLLKLDVQGFELEVLKGATNAMKNAEVVLLEVSLVPYNLSAPLFLEVANFMKDAGFLVYDLCSLPRWDNVLLQTDVFFVKTDSNLRKVNFQ